MSGLECPSCGVGVGPEGAGTGEGPAEGLGAEEAEQLLRRHICHAHLAYRRFLCPHCRPCAYFATRRDAALHAAVEGHPPGVLEEPHLHKETLLAQLLAKARAKGPYTTAGPAATTAQPQARAQKEEPAVEEEEEEELDVEKVDEPAADGAHDGEGGGEEEGGETPDGVQTFHFAPKEYRHCQLCSKKVSSHLHLLTHLRPDVKGILCKHCPPARPFATRWFPLRLKGHTLKTHPGKKIDFIDLRDNYRPLFEDTYRRCFGDFAAIQPAKATRKADPQLPAVPALVYPPLPEPPTKAELVAPAAEPEEHEPPSIHMDIILPPAQPSAKEEADETEEPESEGRLEVVDVVGDESDSQPSEEVPEPRAEEAASTSAPRKAKYQKKPSKCLVCGGRAADKSRHTVQHLRTAGQPALRCLLCPAERPHTVTWFPSEMKVHFSVDHPAAAPDPASNYLDSRPQLDHLYDQTFRRCFGKAPKSRPA